MGMFDYYEPVPSIGCPNCGFEMKNWQGKGGPCALFLWRQGVRSPVQHLVDEDCRLSDHQLSDCHLPEGFLISSYDCPNHAPIFAWCTTTEFIWSNIEIFPFKDNCPQEHYLRAIEDNVRVRRLQLDRQNKP